MLAFPSPANAIPPQNLDFAGTLDFGTGPISISGIGFGDTVASTWTGDFSGIGTQGPLLYDIYADADSITWTGVDTAIQVLPAGTTIVIDSTGAPFPPQAVCVLTLNTAKTLTSSSFPLHLGHRIGTLVLAGGTTVGPNTITNGTNCFTGNPSLGSLVNTAVGGSMGTTALSLTLNKDLY